MNPTKNNAFPYRDFVRAGRRLRETLEANSDPYLLLTAETGAGKTTLARGLGKRLDRCHHRMLYFSCDRKLGASGLVRVLARALRLSPRRSHAETTQDIARQLVEDPRRTILLFDNAHALPDETLLEASILAECLLDAHSALTAFFVGLPPLRERLQSIAELWRRLYVREELTGLTHEEMKAFVEYHFEPATVRRVPEETQTLIFERGRGIPGYMLPMLRVALESTPSGLLDPSRVDDLLQQWDLA